MFGWFLIRHGISITNDEKRMVHNLFPYQQAII